MSDAISAGTKARVELNGEFSAADIEEIIRTLMETRASLAPPVPPDPPDAASEENILVQDDALFIIRTLVDGGLRIWLRNDGLGWMAFTLSVESRRGLHEFLAKKPGHSFTTH